MADYSITAVTRRAVFTGSAGRGPYSFTFPVLAETDLAVYIDSTLKTRTTHWTASISASNGTGSITFASGVTEPTSSNTITIVGARALERTTDFVTAGDLLASSLNVELDSQTIFNQQVSEDAGRAIKAPVFDAASIDMTLPAKATRASKVLAFDSAGEPETTVSSTGLAALGAISSDVSTVAGISANVTTVAGIAANVTAVAGDATDIGAVAAKATEIGRLGTSAAVADMAILGTSDVVTDMNVLATADVVADMNVLASSDFVSDLNTLATSDIVTDMNVLGTSDNVTAMGLLGNAATVEDLGILATSAIVEDLGLLATTANVTAMGLLGNSATVEDLGILASSAIVADLDLLATSANVAAMGVLGNSATVADMALLGTSAVVEDLGILGTAAVVEDLGILATAAVVEDLSILGTAAIVEDLGILGTSANVTAMATVASNVAGVNSFADRYRVGSSDPSSALDAGDLAYNTNSNALKYYNGSAWEAIVSGSLTDIVQDGSPQLGGNLDIQTHSIVSTSNRNIAITPNGSGKVVLDGLSMPTADGNAGEALVTNGSGVVSFSGVGGGNFLGNDGEIGSNANDIIRVHSATLNYDGTLTLASSENGLVAGPFTVAGSTVLDVQGTLVVL